MIAYLFHNTSDKRYIYKTLQKITYQGSDHIEVEFKEDTSVIDPTFILRTKSKVLTANYIFVPDLGRYYYIKDYVLSHQRLYISCHVDVLMSFKSEFKNRTVIVKRNEVNWNVYQNDNETLTYQYTAKRTIPFPNKPFNMANTQFILGIVGNASD